MCPLDLQQGDHFVPWFWQYAKMPLIHGRDHGLQVGKAGEEIRMNRGNRFCARGQELGIRSFGIRRSEMITCTSWKQALRKASSPEFASSTSISRRNGPEGFQVVLFIVNEEHPVFGIRSLLMRYHSVGHDGQVVVFARIFLGPLHFQR